MEPREHIRNLVFSYLKDQGFGSDIVRAAVTRESDGDETLR